MIGSYTVLSTVSALALIAVFFIEPIPQNPQYHLFADRHSYLGVPHFWNVISNLPFVLIGIYGIWWTVVCKSKFNESLHYRAALIFFTGLTLTGFGSGYYHLSPDNQTLVWDRLPMTIAFMAFFSFVLSMHLGMATREKCSGR